MSSSDSRWQNLIRDRRYADLSPVTIPRTETIAECFERVKPLWDERISRELSVGHTVLVVGHRTSLLGLIKHLQGKDFDFREYALFPVSLTCGTS